MTPKWNLTLTWEKLGNIYEVYWSKKKFYHEGPLLYCASLIINDKFLEEMNSGRLKKKFAQFSKIVRDNDLKNMKNSKITKQNKILVSADRRFFHLMKKWKEIKHNTKKNDEILIYIGKVGKSDKNQTLGTRLFESHDPTVSFPIFYLRIPGESINIYTAPVPNAWDLNWVEGCEIFRHKPILNLQSMTNNPTDPEDSAHFKNKIKSKILEPEFTITHKDTFPF